jgi:S-adenosylhomocysteine hydrolase
LSSLPDAEKPRARKEFGNTHPLSDYIVQALAMTRDTAKLIKAIEERGTGESFWENKS